MPLQARLRRAVFGASFAYAFNRGVNRGLYSNEAGQGSAPIAHAAAKTKEPVAEGMVAILEPFIDTLIICTLTGLVILSSASGRKNTPQLSARLIRKSSPVRTVTKTPCMCVNCLRT